MKIKMLLILLLVIVSVFGIVVTASNNNVSNSAAQSEKQEAISESLINNSGQQAIDKPGTIDGAKNPDLIPDRAAYSVLFRLIADRKTPEEKNRIESYIRIMLDMSCKSCGALKENGKIPDGGQTDRTLEQEKADIDAIIAVVEEFSQEVALLDNQAKDAKESRRNEPQAAALRLKTLQAQKNALVDKKTISLINRLSSASRGKLKGFVDEKLKQKIKIAPAAQPVS